MPAAWFLGVLAAIGLMRLAELVHASRNERRLRAAGGVPVDPPGLYPVMVLVHASLFWLPPVEICLAGSQPGWWTWPAAGVLACALVLRGWILIRLGPCWSARAVVPPTMDVVTIGPYRWIRHPNYLVVILELASIPLLHGAWWSALGLSIANGLVLWGRIRAEERALLAIPDYRRLMGPKPRFLPRPWAQ